jgi:hypothetical protein
MTLRAHSQEAFFACSFDSGPKLERGMRVDGELYRCNVN